MDQATDIKSPLLELPLELRHKIYGFSSQRRQPKLIIKEYLEKIDPNIGPPVTLPLPPPPFLPPPPPPPPPAVVNVDEDEEDEDQEEEDAVEDEPEELDDEDESEGQDSEVEDEDLEMTDAEAEGEEEQNTPSAVTANSSATQPSAIASNVTANVTTSNDNDDEAEDEDDGEDEGEYDEDGESEEEESEEEDDNGTAPAHFPPLPPPPPHPLHPRFYGRETKYRHILKTIQLRGCPPPIGLLQTNKQISEEATEFYRRTTILEIDVTKAFQHTSMYLETLEILQSKSFSPIEQVRKVALTFAWDSEWLREKSTPPDLELESPEFFQFFLDDRVNTTIELLKKAPELRHVVIEWYDTEKTDASQNLMNEIVGRFVMSLSGQKWFDLSTQPPTEKALDIITHEHFSEAGTTHAPNSVLALRRDEFDHLLATGLAFR